ncbi:uncharacterized protein BX663DRAFT_515687 [Cokeromyces recurvatus]|uniref:uncharacterized protein n=1 Tax=Cokeromyces recurvatus TaxID=90255 RepID=UPI00221E692D|nr:uncharacterized protein BX663DRAFT_515687 [Cokeromyces recurvatus]KAI7900910.1 hypothetical protein BX663DRAFT_515687 [Cokeromyces recurvatus]
MSLARFFKFITYIRILLYILAFILGLYLIQVFTTQNPPVETFQPSTLPWYKYPHASISHLQSSRHNTVHLSQLERERLSQRMVQRAQQVVRQEFMPTGIRGSIYKDDLKGSAAFRELVDCWTNGSWVQGQPSFTMSHFQDPLYGYCDRKHKKMHPTEPRPATQYKWQSSCPMALVNVSRWCEVLNGHHLLLVGDLVQYQLHEVFLDTLREGPAICFGELNCKDHTLCNGDTRLRYLRNDVLSVRRKMNYNDGQPIANVIEWPFTSSSLMRRYPTVILNRAPVLETDEDFMKGLIRTLKTMRKQNPDALIIYRSTGIGHPFCDEATEPLTEMLNDNELKELPFGWSEVQRRNAIARVIIEGAGGLFVDLAKVTDVRPDGHVGGQDCLRYCIPGPLDGWAQILYQVFLGLEGKHV